MSERATCHDHDQNYWADEGCPVCRLNTELTSLHAQLADAKAAQALLVERAAEACADYPRVAPSEEEWTRYDEQIEHSQRCIRALADTDGLALVQALRKERDAAREVADFVSMGNTGLNQQLSEECGRREKAIADRDRLAAANAALKAQVARLVEGLRYIAETPDIEGYEPGMWAINRARAVLAAVQADARRDGEGGE